jgi:predicted nucleotidyltransferase
MIDPEVRNEIVRRLELIEAPGDVRVLYAVESGSRAWGFPARDSDYDVRFIYIRPPTWYLSVDLESRRDVIEQPIVDAIDLSGWDIRKALRLFAKSNPPLLEWLSSPITYSADPEFVGSLRGQLPDYYSPVASMQHYLHMARGNQREYLRGDTVWVKKYFYVLRPLLAIRWLEQDRGPMPMQFADLLVTVEDESVAAAIETLRQRKIAGDELDRGPAIPEIRAFVEAELGRLDEVLVPKQVPRVSLDALDVLFRTTLERVWMAS